MHDYGHQHDYGAEQYITEQYDAEQHNTEQHNTEQHNVKYVDYHVYDSEDAVHT